MEPPIELSSETMAAQRAGQPSCWLGAACKVHEVEELRDPCLGPLESPEAQPAFVLEAAMAVALSECGTGSPTATADLGHIFAAAEAAIANQSVCQARAWHVMR